MLGSQSSAQKAIGVNPTSGVLQSDLNMLPRAAVHGPSRGPALDGTSRPASWKVTAGSQQEVKAARVENEAGKG